MKQTNDKNLLIISLHADPSMPPGVCEWGGTHTYMKELLTELYDTGYQVILVTRKVYPDENDIEVLSSSCRILRLTLGNFGLFDKRELYYLHEETVRLTIDHLKKIDFKPDIIHSVYWNSGYLALTLSGLWHVPYVHSVISNGRGRDEHGASGTAPHRIETEKMVFSNAAFILCVTKSEKEEICRYYHIDPDKIIVAGQYVHPSFRYAAHDSYGNPRKSGINSKIESLYFSDVRNSTPEKTSCNWWNKQVFTYTGRLSTDKGLQYIMQSWLQLVKKYNEFCPPLWIIGGNPTDIALFRTQSNIAIEELEDLEEKRKLVWWGYLDENGISAIYTKTLILITHSKYEPGGRVAIEAMCEGLPVLATPNGFALDTIHNWVNGFLIPYGDIQTLISRMEHFIKQPYLSNCMGYRAKITGQNIYASWSFKETHLAVYKAAIKHAKELISQSKIPFQQDFQDRELHLYPFNELLIDNADIMQIAINNNISNIMAVNQIKDSCASSFLWEIITAQKKYLVKIPYDRMNLFPLWTDIGEQPLVITGLKRYHAEIGAASLSEIAPITGKDDIHHAIIREKYENIPVSESKQLEYAVNKLEMFYKNNIIRDQDCLNDLNRAIEKGQGYKEIDLFYKRMSAGLFPWQNYFMDYSLRIELIRWRHYYDILPEPLPDDISDIFHCAYEKALEISQTEAELSPVINHGGFDCKNLVFTPEVVLLDNEKIHLGWPGIDYADLLITYIRKNHPVETFKLWKDILALIPCSNISKEVLIGWLLLGTCKEAISETAKLNQISAALSNRTYSLLQLLT